MYLSQLSEIRYLFIISGSLSSLVLVATGSPLTNKVQVVNLQSTNTCTGLPEYPMKLYAATGGLMDGRPLICSGLGRTGSSENDEQLSAWTHFSPQPTSDLGSL